jgi:hypothetical protein
VAADSWAPLQSRHNGIRRYAQATGAEVILNGNTQEGSNDQYLSMVLEKTLAGIIRPRTGSATSCRPASASPHWLFPGAPASHLWGETRIRHAGARRRLKAARNNKQETTDEHRHPRQRQHQCQHQHKDADAGHHRR